MSQMAEVLNVDRGQYYRIEKRERPLPVRLVPYVEHLQSLAVWYKTAAVKDLPNMRLSEVELKKLRHKVLKLEYQILQGTIKLERTRNQILSAKRNEHFYGLQLEKLTSYSEIGFLRNAMELQVLREHIRLQKQGLLVICKEEARLAAKKAELNCLKGYLDGTSRFE
jgi:transcriptional regulator with XRE-family HTH domain